LSRPSTSSSRTSSIRTSGSSFLGSRTLSVASSRSSYSSVSNSTAGSQKVLHHTAEKNIQQYKPTTTYFCTLCPDDFTNIHEWKGHELRFHERQTQYLCTECNESSFTRTSFRTHVREAHGDGDYPLVNATPRNVEASKRRTAWGCGICSALLLGWENRCEHVAAHSEAWH